MSLYTLKKHTEKDIVELISLAIEYKNGKKKVIDKKIANLFFEPSTRTLYSFVSAQMNLGMKFVNFNNDNSSSKKGESLFDTVKTFESIGYDALVIRSGEDNYFDNLKDIKIPVINAGDGRSNHPTQSLLDLMTIYEKFNKFKGLNITIVGDVKHSRVAHTNIDIMKRLGMNVTISGPKQFMDDSAEQIDLDKATKSADIIMLLRVQNERHGSENKIENYNETYGLNKDRLKEMQDDAIIMHPAPFNRGVELTDDVIKSDKSKIWEQMNNGVWIRMAILDKEIK